MSCQRILATYRVLFCLLIIVASVQTLVAEPDVPHLVPLATLEILGALLLMWRRTQWGGLALLLVVFAGAQLMSALWGSWPTRFLQYAASAVLIALMDSALGSQRRSLRARTGLP